MSNSYAESESRAVLKSLESSYCPKAIKEARDQQDEILIERFQGRRYAIADLGCGHRIPRLNLCPGLRALSRL